VWKACDIWSIGVITYLLVCGRPPFNDESPAKIFRKIKQGKWKFPLHQKNKLSKEVKDFITECLNPNWPLRMSAATALKHPWMGGTNVSDEALDKEVLAGLVNFGQQCKLKKAVGKVLGNNMSEKDKEELAGLFQQFDKNGDGKLSPDEIADMMKYIGRGNEDVEAMLANLDEDGDGTVDMEEFQAGQGVAKAENDMVNAFALFDKDGDGFISADEIATMCDFLSPEKAKELMEEADSTGDGKIDLNEWISAMSTGHQKKNETKPT
jgi:calcium-dependent protein kinase